MNTIDSSGFPSTLKAVIQWQRSRLYLGRERYQEALDACNEALRLNPDIPLVFVFRAEAHNSLGQFEQGRARRAKNIWIRSEMTRMDISIWGRRWPAWESRTRRSRRFHAV